MAYQLNPFQPVASTAWDETLLCSGIFGDGSSGPSVLATSFGTYSVSFNGVVDRSEPISLVEVGSPSFSSEGWLAQDGREIIATRATAQTVRTVVAASDPVGPLSYVIPFVGEVDWYSANIGATNESKSFNVSVNYGFTLPSSKHNYWTRDSSGWLATYGLVCLDLADLVCDVAPFNGETYNQALLDYEERSTVYPSGEFQNFGSGPRNVGEGFLGIRDLAPPEPSRARFINYVDQSSGTFGTALNFRMERSRVVEQRIINTIKTRIDRVSANRFRLYMDQQALGGIMGIRYSEALSGGFSGPTIVTIPVNAREAYFDVIPGSADFYTVTLEKCFGLPASLAPAAQFWPLAPDPTYSQAVGP